MKLDCLNSNHNRHLVHRKLLVHSFYILDHHKHRNTHGLSLMSRLNRAAISSTNRKLRLEEEIITRFWQLVRAQATSSRVFASPSNHRDILTFLKWNQWTALKENENDQTFMTEISTAKNVSKTKKTEQNSRWVGGHVFLFLFILSNILVSDRFQKI